MKTWTTIQYCIYILYIYYNLYIFLPIYLYPNIYLKLYKLSHISEESYLLFHFSCLPVAVAAVACRKQWQQPQRPHCRRRAKRLGTQSSPYTLHGLLSAGTGVAHQSAIRCEACSSCGCSPTTSTGSDHAQPHTSTSCLHATAASAFASTSTFSSAVIALSVGRSRGLSCLGCGRWRPSAGDGTCAHQGCTSSAATTSTVVGDWRQHIYCLQAIAHNAQGKYIRLHINKS